MNRSDCNMDIQHASLRSFGLVLLALLLGFSGAAGALPDEWSEEAFRRDRPQPRFQMVRASGDAKVAHTVIGEPTFYEIRPNDTLLDVARYHGLGQTEMIAANPGLDRFGPPAGQLILLPTQRVVPDTPFEGIKVNIPEMRLYYFRPSPDGTAIVTTFPVGLGRDEWRTPRGQFRITEKTEMPTWVLPESIRAEWRAKGKPAPVSIPGGSPDNPLGEYRLRLSLPMYGIHGTNMPWGVGMQVSHGCVRLYPEDIERLYPLVPLNTPGEFLYQPIKLGARDGRIYLEVHHDIYTYDPALHRRTQELIDARGWRDLVDPLRVERAVSEQSGVPMDITLDPIEPIVPHEKLGS